MKNYRRKTVMDEFERGADLRKRTKQFALRIIRLCEKLPARPVGRVIANQLLRSGTSVGANYRAVCHSRSTADFVSKLGVVLEEADESAYWLELVVESGLLPSAKLAPLRKEAEELVAIFAASRITASQHSTAKHS
jgi:four helix bundle protein